MSRSRLSCPGSCARRTSGEAGSSRCARARSRWVPPGCSGAAGLPPARPAPTHWEECALLARQYPAAKVDPDVLFTDEDDILTSAGSAASIDLCLHLVRQDYGTEIAT